MSFEVKKIKSYVLRHFARGESRSCWALQAWRLGLFFAFHAMPIRDEVVTLQRQAGCYIGLILTSTAAQPLLFDHPEVKRRHRM